MREKREEYREKKERRKKIKIKEEDRMKNIEKYRETTRGRKKGE